MNDRNSGQNAVILAEVSPYIADNHIFLMKREIPPNFWVIRLVAVSLALLAGVTAGCVSAAQVSTATPNVPVPRTAVLVLGDIDADDPGKKIKRFQPLADFLAAAMERQGIREGRVVIARDISDMGRMMLEGEVDVYFDSAYPTLAVRDISGSQIILRRWKEGVPEYWSIFVARRDSGLSTVSDLKGKILAVEEPYSTSGFLLPVGTLLQRGLDLKVVASFDSSVEAGQIGYFFTGDEENTVEMILQGRVAAGALSNEDFDDLPPELTDILIAFDRTSTVPRQLVSVRPGLAEERVKQVRELLTGLDQTEDGRQLLAGLKKTSKFDAVSAEAATSLSDLDHMIGQVLKD